eukprot:6651225-Pyramimonas_sp.AAC.1
MTSRGRSAGRVSGGGASADVQVAPKMKKVIDDLEGAAADLAGVNIMKGGSCGYRGAGESAPRGVAVDPLRGVGGAGED